MNKTLMMAALFAAAGVLADKAASAAEGQHYQGIEIALGITPVDQVVTGGTRWRHSGIPRMPTSRDNRLPNDEARRLQ